MSCVLSRKRPLGQTLFKYVLFCEKHSINICIFLVWFGLSAIFNHEALGKIG